MSSFHGISMVKFQQSHVSMVYLPRGFHNESSCSMVFTILFHNCASFSMIFHHMFPMFHHFSSFFHIFPNRFHIFPHFPWYFPPSSPAFPRFPRCESVEVSTRTAASARSCRISAARALSRRSSTPFRRRRPGHIDRRRAPRVTRWKNGRLSEGSWGPHHLTRGYPIIY